VLDDRGQPVAEATVTAGFTRNEDSLLRYLAGSRTRGESYRTTSDANGYFHFTARGKGGTVGASKPGYVRAPYNRARFTYATAFGEGRGLPTKENPALFYLYKERPPERGHEGFRHIQAQYKEHRVLTGGGLDGVADGAYPYGDMTWQWKGEAPFNKDNACAVEIRMLKGGWQRNRTAFNHEAPAEGYQDVLVLATATYEGKADWRHSTEGRHFNVFLHYGDPVLGYYAAAELEIGWYEGFLDMKMEFTGINRSGSRNLLTEELPDGYQKTAPSGTLYTPDFNAQPPGLWWRRGKEFMEPEPITGETFRIQWLKENPQYQSAVPPDEMYQKFEELNTIYIRWGNAKANHEKRLQAEWDAALARQSEEMKAKLATLEVP
jgi:hypothetical protein